MTTRLRMGRLVVDAVTFAEALAAIEQLVLRREGGSVFTPNVDHVVIAESDARFCEAYSRVSLSLVDGMPLLWSSRLLGHPLPEKISGSDLVHPLLERAAARGWRVYLLGGADGSAQKAAENLQRSLPLLQIVGTDAPRVDINRPENWGPSLERLRAARPDIALVGFGAPKQEIFIDACREQTRPTVMVAVGAGIDFLAGAVRRAPTWMSRNGLEWAFRLAQEPRRLAHRYLVRDPQYLAILARDLRRPHAARITGK